MAPAPRVLFLRRPDATSSARRATKYRSTAVERSLFTTCGQRILCHPQPPSRSPKMWVTSIVWCVMDQMPISMCTAGKQNLVSGTIKGSSPP